MDDNEYTWKHIMGAKVCIAIFDALRSMFEAFGIETDYEGEILDIGNIVKTPTGGRLKITETIETPYIYNEKDALDIIGNYDKTKAIALCNSKGVIRKIAVDITTKSLSNLAGNIVYHNGKLIFVYGYLLEEARP